MQNKDISVPHAKPPEGNPSEAGARSRPTERTFMLRSVTGQASEPEVGPSREAPAGRIDSAPTLSSSPRPWLTLPEVADLLALSRAAAYRLADDPSFPSTRIGGAIRVERHALTRWLAARTQRSRKAAG